MLVTGFRIYYIGRIRQIFDKSYLLLPKFCTQKPQDKIHLQTVNNQHKQIRDFLTPFTGEATKYLPNYLNWFVYRQTQSGNREKVKELTTTCQSAVAALAWLVKLVQEEILIRTWPFISNIFTVQFL